MDADFLSQSFSFCKRLDVYTEDYRNKLTSVAGSENGWWQ